MKDKKTYNMELQTGEKTSHKAVSPYWFAFIPAAAFAILTMYVGISESMASGAILFVSVVIVFFWLQMRIPPLLVGTKKWGTRAFRPGSSQIRSDYYTTLFL